MNGFPIRAGINFLATGSGMRWENKTPMGDPDAIRLLESAFWTTSILACEDGGRSSWNASVFLGLAYFLRRTTAREELDKVIGDTLDGLRAELERDGS